MNIPTTPSQAGYPSSPMLAASPLITRLSHWARSHDDVIELADVREAPLPARSSMASEDDMRPRVWNVPIWA